MLGSKVPKAETHQHGLIAPYHQGFEACTPGFEDPF